MTHSLSCPRCGSQRITTRNTARKVGGTIGAATGAAGSVAAAFGGAEAEPHLAWQPVPSVQFSGLFSVP